MNDAWLALLWNLSTLPSWTTARPLVEVALLLVFVFCWDYPVMLLWRLYQRIFVLDRHKRDESAELLAVLVVIPSLLRKEDELVSMMSTVTSIAHNGYPGPLTIVLSIDGTQDAPNLYEQLIGWAGEQSLPQGQRLCVTGTPARRSKPMAIDHAMEFVKQMVALGDLPAFPPVYVSTDADADLGPDALERIVRRLQRKHPLTGWPARVVAGALHVRGDDFWRGFRHFFTIEGQLNIQVAREYYVGNIWRYNIRWLPVTGVPGAFYCTWSEIFLAIPKFMGYMRTLKRRHFWSFWFGVAPPRFSDSTAAPIPELVAGDTDDTVTAYTATIARYQNGHFTFDPPPTPWHALCYMLRGILIDRPLHFEPEARVFTSSPTTVKALFKQRKRWNCSRVELTGRFWAALGYHWTLGLPAMVVKFFMARTVVFGAIAYFVVPVFIWRSSLVTGTALGYVCNVSVWSLMTLAALAINGEFRYWRLLLGVPLAPLYQVIFNWLPCFVGVTSDVLFFGNVTGFAPESTLIRGGSTRIALLSRVRRAFALALRSVVWGDVPLGAFWVGWRETAWTPNGFEGFTTHKRRSTVPPPRLWFRRSRARGEPPC
jgi:hypothetical protein